MRIEHLECLVAAAETGSITQTGHKLFTTQQNISRMLKQLEDEIGYPLFIRTKKGVTLTKEGEIMLTFAKQTLDNLYAAKNKIYNLQSNSDLSGELHLYAYYLATSAFLLKLVSTFKHYYPNVRLNIHESETMQVLKNVTQQKNSIGVVPILIDEKYRSIYSPYLERLAVKPILEDRYLCLTGKHSPIASNKSISLKQFLSHPLVLNQRNSEDEESALLRLFELIKTPNIAVATSNASMYLQTLVDNPEYVGIVGKRNINAGTYSLYSEMTAIPFRENLRFNICIVYAKNKEYSAVHQALADLIRQNYLHTGK